MPWPEINQIYDVFFAPKRYQFGGSNFVLPLKQSSSRQMDVSWRHFIDSNPGQGLEESVIIYECFPKNKIEEVPVDKTAFNNRGNYYNLCLCWAWKDEKLDSVIRQQNRTSEKEFGRFGYHDADCKDGVGIYLNYAAHYDMESDVAFGSHARRLEQLKNRFDATNAFNKPWKLNGKR